MIELKINKKYSSDSLDFSFPEVHPEAKFSIEFRRTFRIPDDDRNYPLPPSFRNFPLRHVDDFAGRVPEEWILHGGVMLPMYQSEALWLNFRSGDYPFAVKVATGKINALSGEEWSQNLHRDPQDYIVVPKQPWLDGYCIEKGLIRQFVAMPLGSGYSAEEQLTGKAKFGGLQISAFPMKAESFERIMAPIRKERMEAQKRREESDLMFSMCSDMGLAPGGKMLQEIYEDKYEMSDWDLDHCSRCFVHITNSLIWETITGEQPPTVPPTAKMYEDAGLPWFEYYQEEAKAVKKAKRFEKLKSIVTLGKSKGENPLPENESVHPYKIINIPSGVLKNQVREGEF